MPSHIYHSVSKSGIQRRLIANNHLYFGSLPKKTEQASQTYDLVKSKEVPYHPSLKRGSIRGSFHGAQTTSRATATDCGKG